jgi:membrane associated rhomboid family serine protease
MIPISDNIPSSSKPIGNYLLIGINMALFLWELKLEIAGELGDLVNSWGVVPARITAVMADAIASGNPAAWIALLMLSSSLLLGIFLHSSFSQILGNLIFLWVFGKSVEDILGHGRFLVFYLLSGILTGVVQILAEPTLTMPLIGANGAIAGVLGAYLLSFPKAKIDTILPLVIILIPIELPALFYLFWWFVQQMFYGIGSLNIAGGVNPTSIAYWAHGVGLVIGAVLVRLCHRG